MDRRYQVFVSSTFIDLVEERSAVITTLLNMDCMPAGMELFPATDDDAWTLIEQVIDESDYYVLVVGGRYGAIDDESKLSYTEKEFDYAVATKKPVMAFLHGDPGSIPLEKSEPSEEAREQLAAFRAKVQAQKHVKYWKSAEELPGLVALSFPKMQRAHPAVGWVRGDVQTSTESLAELNDLRKRAEEAENQLRAARTGPPPGTEQLAQGLENFSAAVQMRGMMDADRPPTRRRLTEVVKVTVTWDQILAAVGPVLLDEAGQEVMREKLDGWFAMEAYDSAVAAFKERIASTRGLVSLRSVESGRLLLDDDFDTMLLQLRALGLITKSERKRSLKETGAFWTLTSYGDDRLTALRAIRREQLQGGGEGGTDA